MLLLIVAGSLAFLLTRQRFGQDPHYHDFADKRVLLGIPNFFDVMSNLPFMVVGLFGLRLSVLGRFAGAATTWTVFFFGVALVSVGSAYYHWQPDNASLVWDRLPMTIGFMAMFVALLSESVNEALARLLLVPALLVGIASVIYWHYSDDLRLYAWVQLVPLVTIPVVMLLFPSRYSHRPLLGLALACYIAAKLTEAYDREIFEFSDRCFAGHAVKHLLAAAGCLVILQMLRIRRPLKPFNRDSEQALSGITSINTK